MDIACCCWYCSVGRRYSTDDEPLYEAGYYGQRSTGGQPNENIQGDEAVTELLNDFKQESEERRWLAEDQFPFEGNDRTLCTKNQQNPVDAIQTRDLLSKTETNNGVTAGILMFQGNASLNMNGTRSEMSPAMLNEIFSEMKSMLKQRHIGYLMPDVPWMSAYINGLKQANLQEIKDENQAWVLTVSDHYIDTAVCSIPRYGARSKEQNIDLQNIFDDINLTGARILIEGPPAYGKSTLTLKVCQDWELGFEYTNRFELVILIPLRNFTKNKFWEGLIDAAEISMDGVNTETIKEVLEKNASTTLLILDGFDELPSDKQKLLNPLLDASVLSEATVLLTSRPGSYGNYETNEIITQRCGLVSESLINSDCDIKFYKLFGKRIIIEGIPETKQQQFLSKHLPSTFPKQQLAKLNQILSNYDKKLFECPLFLLLVAVLATETNLTEVPKNKTDLYKNLFNFIVERGMKLNETGFNETVDLFDYDKEDVPSYVTLLTLFGKFALESVKLMKFRFTKQEILSHFKHSDKRILKLGLMTCTDANNGVKRHVWYEPVHCTLLEFAAAYYLYSIWKSSDAATFKFKLISLLEPLLPDYSQKINSMVLTFLGGLMEKEPKLLFEFLKRFEGNYNNWWESYYEPVLSEIGESDALLTALSSFVPSEWCINSNSFYSSSLHREVLDREVKRKRINSITWDVISPPNFPSQLRVPSLVFNINSESDFGLCWVQCQKLICDNVCFQLLGDEHTKMNLHDWKKLSDLAKLLHFTSISFDFSAACSLEFLSVVIKETKDGFLKDKHIKRIKCELENEKDKILLLLLDMINMVNVEEIHIILWGSKPRAFQWPNPATIIKYITQCKTKNDELTEELWNKFIQRISEIASITVLSVKNYNPKCCIQIDESKLCNGGKKHWNRVDVEGCIKLTVKRRNSLFRETSREEANGTVHIKAFLL